MQPDFSIKLEKRGSASTFFAYFSPFIALGLMLLFGGVLFALMGHSPIQALYVYFVEPLTDTWSLHELAIKASPLILIATGLCLCFRSGNWNIGAEGQFIMGGIAGATLPVFFPQYTSFSILPLMIICGVLGGMAWAFIPALLKNRFGTNEILTSAIIGVLVVWFLLSKTMKGFEILVIGQAPRAGRFAGFSPKRTTIFVFLVSGAFAGLAGIVEVSGAIQQLRPSISPGYGFIAIIVAFLGRLNPLGIFAAGIVLALSYLGGEAVQISLNVTDKIANVFQGLLLFFVLACDTLIHHKIRFGHSWRFYNKEASHGAS